MGMYISGLEFRPGVPGARLKKSGGKKWPGAYQNINLYAFLGSFELPGCRDAQFHEKNGFRKMNDFIIENQFKN